MKRVEGIVGLDINAPPSTSAQLAMSLGKTVAQITAYFAPVPGLYVGTELLCTILQLCQNVIQNKCAIRQLGDRCHYLLIDLKNYAVSSNEPMEHAIATVNLCLEEIEKKIRVWSKLSRVQAFTRQSELTMEIQYANDAIADCLTKFQIASAISIHEWQTQLERNRQTDHDEFIAYFAEISNNQVIVLEAVEETRETAKALMRTMQQSMEQGPRDRAHNGLASNLYQVSLELGELLPELHLKAGEVTRIGEYPVNGTPGMDIFEGLYLQREKVAIKCMRAVNSNEQSLRRFNREATIWAEVWKQDKGQYILPFYGFCQSDGPFPYMVSPWLQNGDALSYVKKNPGCDHKRLIVGIARGLKVLHGMMPLPVVHGDLKGANVFVDRYGRPQIADFGLSRVIEDITGIPFTQSRGVSDSYRWFAPEVCIGQGVLSLSSDVYALAMTALELLTHQQPYAGVKHTTEVVIRSSRGEKPTRPEDPAVISRGLDDATWNLLTACWAIEPAERPSIAQVIERLG